MELSFSKSFITAFEGKAKELLDKVQEHSGYALKLTNDLKVIQDTVSTLNGAVQAYTHAADLLKKGGNISDVSELILEEVKEVVQSDTPEAA